MAGDSGMAARVALLVWGAPSPQLLVKPPWRPAVLWDLVTLTCRGSGTAGNTTWYKDGRIWWQKGPENLTVTTSGTYECDRAGSERSPPVNVSNELLVLQVTAGELVEGDTVTLRCRGRWDRPVTDVRFYRGEKDLGKSPRKPELSLSPLRLQHSGQYRCEASWSSWSPWSSRSPQWVCSDPVSVTVHELFPVPVLEAPAELIAGSPLNLSCLSSRSPLRPLTPLVHRFYRDGRELGGSQGSPQLLLPALGVSGSGIYSCEVQSQDGAVRKRSDPLRVTVLMAAAVGGSLLSLLLLLGAIVGWHRCHRRAPRTPQDRTPPLSPEEGEVLYTRVVPTERAAGSPSATHQVTYAELPGRQWHSGDGGDYENVL